MYISTISFLRLFCHPLYLPTNYCITFVKILTILKYKYTTEVLKLGLLIFKFILIGVESELIQTIYTQYFLI